MNLENLNKGSLSAALGLYKEALRSNDDGAIKIIEDYISRNYSVTNSTRLHSALQDLEKMGLPAEIVKELANVKICTFEIAQGLNPVHITSFEQIKGFVDRQLKKFNDIIDMSHQIAETKDVNCFVDATIRDFTD